MTQPNPKPKLTDPVQFLAFGFGSGLSPAAPGTVGTLMAIPPYLLFARQPVWLYALVVLLATVIGVWLCGRASERLGVHDHPGIVWDEFVGLWIALFAIPVEAPWIVAAFIVFRVFDIAKPWPISWLDQNARGGFGIMVDDIAAGVLACLTLHFAIYAGATL
ncbi:MAG: phosphatidylglycerophosphatase A [Pseudomonadota bacterium]